MAQAAASSPQGTDPQQNNGRVDPSAGPKTPVPSSEELPDSPTAQPPQATDAAPAAPAQTTSATTGQQQQAPQEPQGTATAQRGRTAGGAGSKPAGMAIAPAKQKQTRSLLIKIGALAAAGAAIGTVYALSRGTPSTPPNSASATNH